MIPHNFFADKSGWLLNQKSRREYDSHGVSLISVLSSFDLKTRGKQNGGCELVVLRVCICVGCDVAGAISMAF